MKVHQTISTWFACKALLQGRGCALSSATSWLLMYKPLSLCVQGDFQGKAHFGLWLKSMHPNRCQEGLEVFLSLRIHLVCCCQAFGTPLTRLWIKLLAQAAVSGVCRRDGHRKKGQKEPIQPILSSKLNERQTLWPLFRKASLIRKAL